MSVNPSESPQRTSNALTGIIVAMHEELEIVLQQLVHRHTVTRAGMDFHQGELAGKAVVAVICGVGKVNAATCAQLLISEFKITQLINIGIAGGLGPDIQPGDVVIADTLVQHDIDVTTLGLAPGQIYRLNTFDFKSDPFLLSIAQQASAHISAHHSYTGRIVSGDQFIACPKKSQWLQDEFSALACEMESASIAQVCHLNRLPFVCIRSISDNANTGAHIDFKQFMPIAVQNTSTLLHHMIPSC